MIRAILNTLAVLGIVAGLCLAASVGADNSPQGLKRREAAQAQLSAAWSRAVARASAQADSFLGVPPPAKED
jgi:hypothetical protein